MSFAQTVTDCRDPHRRGVYTLRRDMELGRQWMRHILVKAKRSGGRCRFLHLLTGAECAAFSTLNLARCVDKRMEDR